MSQTTQVQKQNGTAVTLGSWLNQKRDELAKVLPKHLTPERLIRVAINCVAKTPLLAACSMDSLYKCVLACAELGLEPGGALGLAYLVPFKNKAGGYDSQLVVGYRGFIELARRSGQLSQIEAHVVHAGDQFQVEFGLAPKLVHVPKLDGSPGQALFVYCLASFRDGGKHVEVMTIEAVNNIRARSRAALSGPWVTDYEEMARKTVVRRAAKYLPLSPELAQAFEADDDVVDVEAVQNQAPQLAAETGVIAGLTETATQRAKERVRAKVKIDDKAPDAAPSPPMPPPEPGADFDSGDGDSIPFGEAQ